METNLRLENLLKSEKFDCFHRFALQLHNNTYIRMAVENNVTIFYRKTDETVKCTICGMNCSEPEESYGFTSLSAARAGVKEKHWVSECKFVDTADHQEAQILWERLHGLGGGLFGGGGIKWTKSEKENFTSQLETLRAKIANNNYHERPAGCVMC